MKAPVAERIEHHEEHHGHTLDDPYHWLKDHAYPEVADERVLAYLQSENAYFEAAMKPHQPLMDTLFAEIKGRQPAEDESVPYRKGDFHYRWRYEKDAQYRLWQRAPAAEAERWHTILDEPALAAEYPYFSLGSLSVSPDGRYLAWSADTNGSERFDLAITDLETGERLDEIMSPSIGAPVWASDSQHLFYLRVNENWRPYQVLRHRLGSDVGEDQVVYEEADEGFFVSIGETQSEQWLIIASGDHITSESYVVPADKPLAQPRLLAARRTGHEYHVDHREGMFYIRTNDTHKNFRLVKAADDNANEDQWQSVIDGSDQHYLTDHMCFRHFLIVAERIDGLDHVRIIDDNDQTHHIQFPESAYSTDFGANPQYDSRTLRLVYESMITPMTVYDYDIDARVLHTRKVQEIPSGYEAADYRTERLLVAARDGVQVPVSVVYHRDTQLDGSAPAFLYGYGAYGYAVPPGFSPSRLSLLDRGFVFAIAHVRGGDDLGYGWYEDGKLDKRTNTFNDFVDVAHHLAENGYSRRGRIAISGGSAGGELVGAAVNQDPELFGVVVAHVPFVDVLNTMLDTSLPLTPMEWPEWGNPIEDKQAFEYIHSYSPYDQLKPGAYPPMLVTAGLNDPRVTYWEPAKYVAKLRHLKTDDNLLVMKTNMDAGHRGQSGRFDALKEVAEEYAFVVVSLDRP
jgi:oligopeptidase B